MMNDEMIRKYVRGLERQYEADVDRDVEESSQRFFGLFPARRVKIHYNSMYGLWRGEGSNEAMESRAEMLFKLKYLERKYGV